MSARGEARKERREARRIARTTGRRGLRDAHPTRRQARTARRAERRQARRSERDARRLAKQTRRADRRGARADRRESRAVRRASRRLSLLRVLIVIGLTALTGTVVAMFGAAAVERVTIDDAEAWFAPYVDVTLPPLFNFEDPTVSHAETIVLGFVVAAGDGSCTPTWGTHFTLAGAAKDLDLDRRIERLRERGGDPLVSFGGALNDELAVVCDDADDLADAYAEVIERYDLDAVDLDIEGEGLRDVEAHRRRGEALAALQQSAGDQGLDVWMTLPVTPNGLPPEAVELLDVTVEAGVDLAGVNVMTMNYGASRTGGMTMWQATEQALTNTWRQLRGVYDRAGDPRTPEALWAMIGATPNIGQNDVPTDLFSLDDAERLLEFAARYQIGRVSMWSANRDGPCGAQVDTNVYQPTCTGLDQELLAFTYRFAALTGASADAGDDGRADGGAAKPAPAGAGEQAVDQAGRDPRDLVDDPATSPYPIWRSSKVYETSDKVVWHRDVYEAKWWTQGDLPDEPVVNVWDSPWRYLGPVLPGELPGRASDDDEGASSDRFAAWDPDAVYTEGSRVSHDGYDFQARWWTTGTPPDPDPDTPWDTPWEVIDD